MRGMLDLTDNRVGDGIVPPPQRGALRRRRSLSRGRGRQGHRDLLRHRQRRSASSTATGSATPSPRAARRATTTRAWGSPRAAPGSWSSGCSSSSGKDCQSEPFTAIGIGDMSGDVFGNGMLLSQQIRLIAAFDHRHIFIDPDPDPATSFAERKRLFELPRSSWDDYDRSKLSAGRRRLSADASNRSSCRRRRARRSTSRPRSSRRRS